MNPRNAGAYLDLGKICRSEGRLSEAEAALLKALEFDPQNGCAHIELGALYEDRSEFTQAAAEFERVIAIEPKHGVAHCQLGRIYRRQGRLAEAEVALHKALELDPQGGWAMFELGALYADQNRFIEAEAALRKALEFDPLNSCARMELGALYEDQGKSVEAAAEFERVIAIDPDNGEAYCHLGRMYRWQRRWSEAEAALRKALELDTGNVNARIELGALYEAQRDFPQAAANYERALAMDSNHGGVHCDLGRIYRRQGRLSEAEAEFQKALAIEPKNDRAYMGLWAICRSQGRAAEAEAASRKASALNPRNAWACAGSPERLDRDKAGSDSSKDPMREGAFCLLPWTYLHIRADGSLFPCCPWSGPPLGNARSSSIADLVNSPGMKALRSDLMNGRPVAGCQRCYEDERSVFRSVRQSGSIELGRHRDRERLTASDGTLPRLPVPYLMLRFSNLCNLRCRMCNPFQSSAWAADAQALGWPVKSEPIQKPYDDWDGLWRQLQPMLEEGIEIIHFVGGEPLIVEEHYRILDFLIARKLTDVRLRYNTNFSVLRFQGRDVTELWSRFRNVDVVASLDGSGRRGEYMRKGLSWNTVVANREEMLRRCPDVTFSIHPTLSIFNALHLPDFHREWVEKGYIDCNKFSFDMLVDPAIYRMQVLPAALKQRVLESYQRHQESFLDADGSAASDFAAATRFLQEQDCSELLPDFVAMTRRLDALRGEDCREVFPELAGLFEAAA